METERPATTMLLLGDVTNDGRVIKTTRALQDAGHTVTLFCLARHRSQLPPPDLHGASVRWVAASSPLARLLTAPRRIAASLRRPPAVPATAHPHTATPATAVAPGTRLRVVAIGHPRTGRQSQERYLPLKGATPPTRGRGLSPAAMQVVRDLRAFAGTLRLGLVLARAAAGTPATSIHVNDLDTLLPGVLLARAQNARLVYDAHELYSEMLAERSALYGGLWRLLEHRLIRRADAVITVNESIAGELQRRHQLARRPAVVLNCPPLQDLPRTDTPTAAAIADGVGPAGETLLLYHGHFQPGRGLETLIEAMREVAPGATLCLRGSGPLRPALQALVELHGLQQRVRFLDPVPPDQLVAALVGFSIGVVPYLPTSLNNYLCTPNKLFEYLMGGLAVLASDLPELRRVVQGSGAGLLYPASDPRELAQVLNGMLQDRIALVARSGAARQAALTTYNWERQAAILRGVYAELR